MRHIASSSLCDFAAIYDSDVELVTVSRSAYSCYDEPPIHSLENIPALQCQWIQQAEDSTAMKSALEKSMTGAMLAAFVNEIQSATAMLGELLGCDQVGVRMTTLQAPMCPRFHVDAVPCRLLNTFFGPATEWISHPDVDEQVFVERKSEAPPLKEGAHIRQLGIGAWSLLKGGAWQEDFGGVVHRSPRVVGSRLLVSLDPLFTEV